MYPPPNVSSGISVDANDNLISPLDDDQSTFTSASSQPDALTVYSYMVVFWQLMAKFKLDLWELKVCSMPFMFIYIPSIIIHI